ncbi:T9SS type B sorting domain-containing protein [Flavilitoribacter nigricans]|nr:T9SS type B sorting domain-containing protein [Flavilitoribacter nigricans]
MLGIGYQSLIGQTGIRLDECDVPYVDPQEAGDDNGQNRDTLYYETYFAEPNQVRSFFIDINAFGGQQTDRVKAYVILPDSTRKEIGGLEFGNCVDCVEGFALMDQNELLVTGVSDEATMNMWLQSLNQPDYQLPGNLQTLVGVGRISGVLPACAIGLFVEYSVYSNPNNASTEFATYIHCPEIIGDCAPELSRQIVCQQDSLYLTAAIDPNCIIPGAAVRWTDRNGWSADGLTASRQLSGHLGWYYFEVEDECCTLVDSILVEIPPFAMAGADQSLCAGEALSLSGSGGMQPYWEFKGNSLPEGPMWQVPSVSMSDNGQYVYHAFDADGCEDTDTLMVSVNEPLAPVLAGTSPCFGDTLFLSLDNPANFSAFTWMHPNGTVLSPPFVTDFQADDTGNYTFTATDINDCPVEAEVAISGAPLPAFDYEIEPNCDSTRIYLFPDIYQYAWSTGDTGAVLASATGGDFQLSITDAVGCQTTTPISLPAPEGPAFDVVLDQAACPGEGANVRIEMANPDLPVIFSLDAGQTYSLSPEFTGLAPGIYGLQVQDDLGCIQTQRLIIPAPDTMGVRLPVERLDVRPNTPISLQAETVGNIVAYQWVPEIIDSGGPNTDFVATQDMDIRLVVEDDQGCRAVAGLPLTIVLGDIYVPDVFSPNDDGVNDGFTFFSDLGSGEQILFLRIFDRNGGLLFSTEEQPLNEERLGWDGRQNGRELPEGVYVYHGAILYGNGYIRHLKGDVTLVR